MMESTLVVAADAAGLSTVPGGRNLTWGWPVNVPLRMVEVAGGAAAGLGVSTVIAETTIATEGIGGAVLLSVVTAAITAFGTAFFQPWLRTRDLERRLKDLEELNVALAENVKKKEADIATAMERIIRVAEASAKLNERNARLAETLLVRAGQIQPGTAAGLIEAVTESHHEPTGPLVLLVEDDFETREHMTALLALSNYRVSAVGTFAGASELLATGGFDAILLDLMLPDGDGAALIGLARTLVPKSRVIVTTGKDSAAIEAVLASAPDALFRKPVDFIGWIVPSLRGERVAASLC